eukprot:Clim_evm15s230 gene=Clim_evmTU15s230
MKPTRGHSGHQQNSFAEIAGEGVADGGRKVREDANIRQQEDVVGDLRKAQMSPLESGSFGQGESSRQRDTAQSMQSIHESGGHRTSSGLVSRYDNSTHRLNSFGGRYESTPYGLEAAAQSGVSLRDQYASSSSKAFQSADSGLNRGGRSDSGGFADMRGIYDGSEGGDDSRHLDVSAYGSRDLGPVDSAGSARPYMGHGRSLTGDSNDLLLERHNSNTSLFGRDYGGRRRQNSSTGAADHIRRESFDPFASNSRLFSGPGAGSTHQLVSPSISHDRASGVAGVRSREDMRVASYHGSTAANQHMTGVSYMENIHTRRLDTDYIEQAYQNFLSGGMNAFRYDTEKLFDSIHHIRKLQEQVATKHIQYENDVLGAVASANVETAKQQTAVDNVLYNYFQDSSEDFDGLLDRLGNLQTEVRTFNELVLEKFGGQHDVNQQQNRQTDGDQRSIFMK